MPDSPAPIPPNSAADTAIAPARPLALTTGPSPAPAGLGAPSPVTSAPTATPLSSTLPLCHSATSPLSPLPSPAETNSQLAAIRLEAAHELLALGRMHKQREEFADARLCFTAAARVTWAPVIRPASPLEEPDLDEPVIPDPPNPQYTSSAQFDIAHEARDARIATLALTAKLAESASSSAPSSAEASVTSPVHRASTPAHTLTPGHLVTSLWTPAPLRHPDTPNTATRRVIAKLQEQAKHTYQHAFTRGQEIGFADAKIKFTKPPPSKQQPPATGAKPTTTQPP